MRRSCSPHHVGSHPSRTPDSSNPSPTSPNDSPKTTPSTKATKLSHSQSSTGKETSVTPTKPTRRQNARMQLAAALIEADNEAILRKAQELMVKEREHADGLGLGPSHPPVVKLASDSVLFRPWREDDVQRSADSVEPTNGRVADSGIIRKIRPIRSVQRPTSIDFLDLTLPGERRSTDLLQATPGTPDLPQGSQQRPRLDQPLTHAGSFLVDGEPGTSLYTIGAVTDNSVEDPHSTALEEWGVDKIMSQGAQNDNAVQLQRDLQEPQSSLTSQPKTFESDQLMKAQAPVSNPQNDVLTSTPLADRRKSSDYFEPKDGASLSPLLHSFGGRDGSPNSKGSRRTLSEASISTNVPFQRTPDLELLAKIKLYRQQQDNVPPSQWASTAEEGALRGSVPSASLSDHVATRLPEIVTSPDSEKEGTNGPERPLSSRGYTGDSWTDQGSELPSGGRSRASTMVTLGSRGMRTQSMHLPPPPPRVTSMLETSGKAEGNVPQEPSIMSARRESMAGIGSYSADRRTSFIDLPLSPQESHGENPAGKGRNGRSKVSSPLAQHTYISGDSSAASRSSMSGDSPVTKSFPSKHHNYLATQNDFYTALALADSPSPEVYRLSASPTLGLVNLPPLTPPLDPVVLASGNVEPRGQRRLSSTHMTVEELSKPSDHDSGNFDQSRPSASFSTKELQALARQSRFPESYGIGTPAVPRADTDEQFEPNRTLSSVGSFEVITASASFPDIPAISLDSTFDVPTDGLVPVRSPGRIRKVLRPMTNLFTGGFSATQDTDRLKAQLGGNKDLDLSSSRWGQSKRTKPSLKETSTHALGRKNQADSRDGLHQATREPVVEHSLDIQAKKAVDDFTPELPAFEEDDLYHATVDREADVDDEYVSPPRKGPRKPKGVDAWLPETLIVPEPLQYSPQMPRTKLTDASSPLSKLVHPISAPHGIGRRGNLASTAIFRNWLVQNDEEKEGWGWELSSLPHPVEQDSEDDGELAQKSSPSKKEINAQGKVASKQSKLRRKAKREKQKRRHRQNEVVASGNAVEEAIEGSSEEDFALTEDSESTSTLSQPEQDSGSEGEEPLVENDSKPAGKLFGKSLLDIAQEKIDEKKAATKYYGQCDVEKAASLDDEYTPSIAPSFGARSFKDTPLGHNDTRERMQAAFGIDVNWEREMEKKLLHDAQEEEELQAMRRAAEARGQQKKRGKKSKKVWHSKKENPPSIAAVSQQPTTPLRKEGDESSFKQIEGASINNKPESYEVEEDADATLKPEKTDRANNVEAPRLDIVGLKVQKTIRSRDPSASTWFPPSSDSSDESSSDEHRTRRPSVQPQEPQWGRSCSAAQPSKPTPLEASDDEVPLSVLKRRTVSSTALLSRHTSSLISEEEEELPLAQLRKKRLASKSIIWGRQSSIVKSSSDPTVAVMTRSSSLGALTPDAFVTEASDATFRIRPDPPILGHLSNILPSSGKAKESEEEDSDEDRPLVHRHSIDALAAFRKKSQSLLPPSATGNSTSEYCSEDDTPLGASHPQAAIITQQAALIKQLQIQSVLHRQSLFVPSMNPMLGIPSMAPTMHLPFAQPMSPHPMLLGSVPDLRAANFLAAAGLVNDPRSPTLPHSMESHPTSDARFGVVAPHQLGDTGQGESNTFTHSPATVVEEGDSPTIINRWRNNVVSGSDTPSSMTATTLSSM